MSDCLSTITDGLKNTNKGSTASKSGIHHEAHGLSAPKRYVGLEPVKVTLFGKRVFTDIITLRTLTLSWVKVGPESNNKCPSERGEGHVRWRHLCTKEHQGTPAATGSHQKLKDAKRFRP